MDNNGLYIPLKFWYNTNPGLAIPLILINSPIETSDFPIPYWKLREYNNFTLGNYILGNKFNKKTTNGIKLSEFIYTYLNV